MKWNEQPAAWRELRRVDDDGDVLLMRSEHVQKATARVLAHRDRQTDSETKTSRQTTPANTLSHIASVNSNHCVTQTQQHFTRIHVINVQNNTLYTF